MDEQKYIILFPTPTPTPTPPPVLTQERFAQLTGLIEGQVRGLIEKGHLPFLTDRQTPPGEHSGLVPGRSA